MPIYSQTFLINHDSTSAKCSGGCDSPNLRVLMIDVGRFSSQQANLNSVITVMSTVKLVRTINQGRMGSE